MQDSSSSRCNRLPPVRRDAPARRIRSRSSARLKQPAVQVEHLAMDAEGPLAELQGVEEAPLPEVLGVGQDRMLPPRAPPAQAAATSRATVGPRVESASRKTRTSPPAAVAPRFFAGPTPRCGSRTRLRRGVGRGEDSQRRARSSTTSTTTHSSRSAGYCCMPTDPMAPAMQTCSLRASRGPPPLRPPPPMAIIPTASRRRACRAHHQHQESPTA